MRGSVFKVLTFVIIETHAGVGAGDDEDEDEEEQVEAAKETWKS